MKDQKYAEIIFAMNGSQKMYNYYRTNNQKGILLSYDLGEKEAILFMANFEDVLDYYSDEEKNLNSKERNKPLFLNPSLKEELDALSRENFLHIFNKWFIMHSSISSEKISYITSAMRTWGIYN